MLRLLGCNRAEPRHGGPDTIDGQRQGHAPRLPLSPKFRPSSRFDLVETVANTRVRRRAGERYRLATGAGPARPVPHACDAACAAPRDSAVATRVRYVVASRFVADAGRSFHGRRLVVDGARRRIRAVRSSEWLPARVAARSGRLGNA